MRRRLTLLFLFAVVGPAAAQETDATEERPFVTGGVYDKPFIVESSRASFGGYLDAQYRYERTDGIPESSFILQRFNLFAFAPVSERVRVAAEIEFEDGGEEVKIELAIVDFEIHPSVSFRGGMLLTPLGRFNLAHDSPTNELTDRPLVSTEIIGVTLSEPGMGFYGSFYPANRWRITYETYLVNGYDDGVVTGGEGTSIPEGRGNFEDNNNRPSFVGRVALSPVPAFELGLSGHTGAYNTWKEDGLDVDRRRDLSIVALDWDLHWRRFSFLGEAARASVDIPSSLSGVFAEDQAGYYLEGSVILFENALPNISSSHFRAVVRWDDVDFDLDTDGDTLRRLTLGANFRVAGDTVFKLDYQYNWARDAFNNPGNTGAILFSVASYF